MGVGYKKSPARVDSKASPFLKTGNHTDYDKLTEFYELDTAVVVKVITKAKDPDLVGAILCKPLNSAKNMDDSKVTLAYPLDPNFKQYPIKDEMVLVGEHGASPKIFYQTINYLNSPNYNGSPSLNSDREAGSGQKITTTFRSNNGIKNLTPNPGDTIIQGRFGSSVRLTSRQSDDDATYDPILIITNKLSQGSFDSDGDYILTENINEDGSTLTLSSGLLSSELTPDLFKKQFTKETLVRKAYEFNSTFRGRVNSEPPLGSNRTPEPFETNQHTFPRILEGDQLLLSSNRIVLTSKVNEMLFFSKGQIGLFTDNKVSIDSKRGVDLASPRAQFRGRFDRFYLSGPAIFLGVEEDRSQPALLGNNTLLFLNIMLNSQVQFLRTAAAYLEAAESAGMLKIPGFAETFDNHASWIEQTLLGGGGSGAGINPTYRNIMLSNKVFLGSNEMTYTLDQ